MKANLLEKEPSTDTNSPDSSPLKDRWFSPEPSRSDGELSPDKRKIQKRKLILTTIKNRLKIKNIKNYVINQDALTGDLTTFDDVYKIKGLLGSGGFGVVLAVGNRSTKTDNALKIWMKSDHARIINEEGNVLSSFDHPSIIKFKNFYETNSRLLIEMELWRGGSLKNLIKKRSGPFKEDEVLVIMRNLINSISYIHSKDYIHRDIKPDNILFKEKGDLSSLKLIDFGLSTIFPGILSQSVKDKIGTILYMAPEQTDYSSYGKKVDVWAWGVIMYQLLTGSHPIHKKGDTEAVYLKKLEKRQDLKLPEELEISDMWRDFHARLSKHSPTERYESKTALLHPWILGDHNADLPLTPLEKIKQINAEDHLKILMKTIFSLSVLKSKLM